MPHADHLEPLIRSLASELPVRESASAGVSFGFDEHRVLEGESSQGAFRIVLYPYNGYDLGNGATLPELDAPLGRAPATLTLPQTRIELVLARASPYPVSLRARRAPGWDARPPGLFGRILEALRGGDVWSDAGARPVFAPDRRALGVAEREVFERHGQPFESGDPHFDALVVAHSARPEDTRARLFREGVRARCVELVRHNEPYSIAIRFGRDAILWTTDLSDRTPPAMLRGLLDELPRLQGLLFD